MKNENENMIRNVNIALKSYHPAFILASNWNGFREFEINTIRK